MSDRLGDKAYKHLTKVPPEKLDRRIHVWVKPIGSYALREQVVQTDLRYCPCKGHYITESDVQKNGCRRLCG